MPEPALTDGTASLDPPVPGRPYFQVGVWLLHSGLFFTTFLTTTAFGSALVDSFANTRALTLDAVIAGYTRLFHLEGSVWAGLYFSIPLLTVLLAHELGHFLECRKRGVDASLPFFLPSLLTFGTFGAFIRIRSPIYTRQGLFDIGIKGPLAGFLALLPFLWAGVARSRVLSAKVVSDAPALADSLTFGTPLALRLVEQVCFGKVPSDRILLHPIAMAAWAGLFATAFNLLPVGQLDGGHILYAVGSERWHRRIGTSLLALLAIGGIIYWPEWLVGAAILFFFGRRHPLVYDSTPLSPGRLLLCGAALIVLILSATVVPVSFG